jgi:hypothetical protein
MDPLGESQRKTWSTLNSYCREFSIDRNSKQLEDILSILIDMELFDLGCLLQMLLAENNPTVLGGNLLASAGKRCEMNRIVPYHMNCFVNASDSLNNFILNNNSIGYVEHQSVISKLSEIYKPICEGTNFWREDLMVIPREKQTCVITMTTCKRLELFIQTVQSFLVCCKDLSVVDAWYTVDDNSSEDDRNTMREMFPWMLFIWKTPETKGHAKSMNILHNALPSTVKYILHLEDDWKYLTRQNYIGKAIKILEEFPDLGQILFNRHYGENAEDVLINNGILRGEGITTHLLHEHKFIPGLDAKNKYWPHFSLRPGITRKEIWDGIAFDESSRHFELTFAHDYMSAGWLTGFFNSIVCVHTGRHVNTNLVKNAYDLNGEVQFTFEDELESSFVKIENFKSINRILKRSQKLRPKNWFFGITDKYFKHSEFILKNNLRLVEWDALILKISGNEANDKLLIVDTLELSTDEIVVVKHSSITKIISEVPLKLRVYICNI